MLRQNRMAWAALVLRNGPPLELQFKEAQWIYYQKHSWGGPPSGRDFTKNDIWCMKLRLVDSNIFETQFRYGALQKATKSSKKLQILACLVWRLIHLQSDQPHKKCHVMTGSPWHLYQAPWFPGLTAEDSRVVPGPGNCVESAKPLVFFFYC